MSESDRELFQSVTNEVTTANKELEKDLVLKKARAAAMTKNARLQGDIAILDSDDEAVIAEREARAALEAEGIRTDG